MTEAERWYARLDAETCNAIAKAFKNPYGEGDICFTKTYKLFKKEGTNMLTYDDIVSLWIDECELTLHIEHLKAPSGVKRMLKEHNEAMKDKLANLIRELEQDD